MKPPALVVIGCSWGGLYALREVLSGLSSDYPAAIAVAQHRLPSSSDGLAQVLQSASNLPIVDVMDKTPVEPSHVYLAPADYHLIVQPGSFALSTTEPVMYARPSVDVLFESAAVAYGMGVVAIVLTGSNEDGAAGARVVKECGGVVIVQDPAEAMRPEMPRAALGSVPPDAILKLSEIGPFLDKLLHEGSGVR